MIYLNVICAVISILGMVLSITNAIRVFQIRTKKCKHGNMSKSFHNCMKCQQRENHEGFYQYAE